MGFSQFPDAAQYPSGNTPIILGYSEITADTAALADLATITGLSVTVTVPAGRRIKVTGHGQMNASAAAGWLTTLRQDGVDVGRLFVNNYGAAGYAEMDGSQILTPTAGTHTYTMYVDLFSGSGTMTVNALPGYPAFLLVEDITGIATPVPATSVPVGQLAYTENFAHNQSATNTGATWVDIAGGSLNIAVSAGRVVRLRAKVHLFTDVGSTRVELAIREGSTLIQNSYLDQATAGFGQDLHVEAIISPTAGAHTYQLSMRCQQSSVLKVYSAKGSDSYDQFIAEDITPTPALANTAPSSTLAYQEATAGDTFDTTGKIHAGLSATVTVPAGRRLKITVWADASNDANAQRVQGFIYRDGSSLKRIYDQQATASDWFTVTGSVVDSPAAGTHTYAFFGTKVSTGNWSTNFFSDRPPYILVEDITGTSLPLPTSTGLWKPAAVFPSSPSAGDLFFDSNAKIGYQYTGTAWREYSAPRYAARLYRGANLAVAGGFASTVVPMDTLVWADNSIVFQGGANYTCPIAGLYQVTVNLELDTGEPSSLAINIGSDISHEGGRTRNQDSGGIADRAVGHNATAIGSANAGDVIYTSVWNDGGAATNIREGWSFTWMEVRRIGPRHDSGYA